MVSLKAGEYLLREGDAATCGFLIESGDVEVVLERPDGDRLLATLGPGEIVGEMALVDASPRSASVRACSDTTLLPITAEHIATRLATADPVLRLVLGTILERFRATLRTYGAQGAVAAHPPRRKLAADLSATAELRLEKELETALRTGEIIVHYQPIVRMIDGRLTGFEALARWAHPMRGLVPPSIFVPIAEVSGLSTDLARICLEHVSRDIEALRVKAAACADHIDTPRVSVNISGHDLTRKAFAAHLSDMAARVPGDVAAITLELTETALVRDPGDAVKALELARKLGFKIAVDDFGTGYSSLNYIRTLPIDSLKIDRSFVQGMLDCETTRSIIASTLRLAESLGLKVVAEGIETAEQHALLQMLGCEFSQGYLYGRPLPLDRTLELMDAWRVTTVEAPSICVPSA